MDTHKLCVRLAAESIYKYHSASPFPNSEHECIVAAFEPTMKRLVEALDRALDMESYGAAEMFAVVAVPQLSFINEQSLCSTRELQKSNWSGWRMYGRFTTTLV